MPMQPSMAIANEFIRRARREGVHVTQMKVQKLVYLANGWNWAINLDQLVDEMPEAWNYGPVYPDLYRHTRFFGSKPIEREITPDDDDGFRFWGAIKSEAEPYAAELTDRERAVLDNVWERYKGMSAFQLSQLTHQPGSPWFETFFEEGRNRPIMQRVIQQHYGELIERAEPQD